MQTSTPFGRGTRIASTHCLHRCGKSCGTGRVTGVFCCRCAKAGPVKLYHANWRRKKDGPRNGVSEAPSRREHKTQNTPAPSAARPRLFATVGPTTPPTTPTRRREQTLGTAAVTRPEAEASFPCYTLPRSPRHPLSKRASAKAQAQVQVQHRRDTGSPRPLYVSLSPAAIT